jgi:hypothetical protein
MRSTSSDQPDDFARLGVPPELLFREDELAVYHDLEYAAGRLNQQDLGIGKRATQLGRQTGGPRFVVSNDAVFDRDTHGLNISGA